MSYSLPTFNLMADVYTNGTAPAGPPRVTLPCNLQCGRRRQLGLSTGDFDVSSNSPPMFLLVPALSDIRDNKCASSFDVVECPPASGRWYRVLWVDDVGKGFPNEFRLAVIEKYGVSPTFLWPQPIP